MSRRTQPLNSFTDERGVLLKAWPHPVEGEVYVVEIRPGRSRGHHFHRHGGEWFVPIQGRAVLVVEDPVTGSREVIALDGLRARVEPGEAHALFAQGTDSAWVIAIADRAFDDDETVPSQLAPPDGQTPR